MLDARRSSTDERTTSSDRSAGVPGKQTLTSQLPPAPATATTTATAATAATAATPASPVPPEVLSRIGAEFLHSEDTSARRQYRITAGGGFLLIASSDGTPPGKLEFRHDNKYKAAWTTLCGYVARNQASIAPTVAEPAPVSAPAAPAPDPWSFESLTAAIGGRITTAGNAVVGAVGSGLAMIGGGAQAIENAIAGFFGATPEPAPGATPTPGATPAPDTATPGTTPAPDATAPGNDAPRSIESMPAMSQFRWYDNSFAAMGIDDVFAAAKIIADTFGFGGPVAKVTEPAADVKKKNPNQGYWWFTADGTPTWNGTDGTQYVTFTIHDGETSSKLNPVSAYLAEKPPGKRPATMVFGGKTIDVPANVQSLGLRNIPGPRSCFATSAAMMAQAGVHAVGSDLGQGILPITGEKYREYTQDEMTQYPDEADRKKNIAREVISVTPDPAAAAKARAYIDFEIDHGRPVFAGITYKEAPTLNNDQRTDHWVVIAGRAGAGIYTFNDPSNGSSGKHFEWDGEKLHQPKSNSKHPEYLYVVSWIRPNAESLAEWNAHWAQQQAGGVDAEVPKTA